MFLLSTNTKLDKLNGIDYLGIGLSLAPHGIGGFQVCPQATAGCKASCVLWFTGRTVTQSVRAAMIRRKRLLVDDPSTFYARLRRDIKSHIRTAERQGLIPAFRLNVASDLDWSHVARDYPQAKFYDYTKVKSRLRQTGWPPNYDLTYSVNERSHWRTIRSQLDRGGNVSAVFSTRYHPQSGRIDPLPQTWQFGGKRYRIVDGDIHDVRLHDTDGHGVIVGLRFKGSLQKRSEAIKNGFCLDVSN